MSVIVIEQALYGSQAGGGYRFVAKSAGFREDWLPEAERLCIGFGERPAGAYCTAAVFVQTLDRKHIAIVQVADQGTDDAGRPGALGFRLLVFPRTAYDAFGGDPFALADKLPPDWNARGELPSLELPATPLPPRTTDEVKQVLQRDQGPNLLGACQVLVDGGRVVFERPAPDVDVIRYLWTLLPTRTRAHLRPASFAFGNALGFDALVTPHAAGPEFAHYVKNEETGDYPEGRYERNLQIAAESGDQRDLDTLLSRRSRRDTLKLSFFILAAMLLIPMLLNLLVPQPDPETKPRAAPTAAQQRDALPKLPPAKTLDAPERTRLTQSLHNLAAKLDVAAPDHADAEQLLAAIDERLGTPDPQRNPGKLSSVGSLEAQLRALAWKHGIDRFDDPALNATELVERLQEKLAK
jgi:hypothetical protein